MGQSFSKSTGITSYTAAEHTEQPSLAACYMYLPPSSTNVKHMEVRQQISPVQYPKHFSNIFLAPRKTCFEVQFPGSTLMTFCNISKLSEQGCSSRKGPSVWTLPVSNTFQHSTDRAVILLLTTSGTLSSPWKIWPFTNTHAATSVARSAEYCHWNFQIWRVRCPRPHVFQKERTVLQTACHKDALRHAENWPVWVSLHPYSSHGLGQGV